MMKKVLLIIVIALVLAGVSTVRASEITEQEAVFVKALNEYRVKNGRQPVIVCFQLSEESRKWSRTMRRQNRLYHDPNGGTEICAQIMQECGITALRAWQRSSAHNSILLAPWIRVIGIGSADRWWTMRGRGDRTVERTREVTRTEQTRVVQQTRTVSNQRPILFPRLRARFR